MTTTEFKLTDSINEIKASPKGPKTAVFFDLDGTVISGYSAGYLAKDRIRQGEMSLGEIFRTISVAINGNMGNADFEDLLKIGADSWIGRSDSELNNIGEQLFQKKIINLIHPEMRKIVRAHQERGHTVVLSSSATKYQVEPVARFLGINHVICNRFSVKNDLLTGEIEKPVVWGKGKAVASQDFAIKNNIDIKNCFFYADGDEDTALMYLVGNPRPINPGKRLTKVANSRGWPIQRFTSRANNGKLRTLAGVASVFPISYAGLAVGLLKKNKRAGFDFALPLWLEAMFRINGVSMNVIGRENLWSHRPAVFIFNHRNNFDAFLSAQLIEKDFTGIGKKELEDHWLTGTFGKLADVAFIDRDDTKSTLEQMKPIEELVNKGLSVGLAPEGTRVDTEEVGPFKKGAFRIAMAAGVPIVPIVFRNAEMIAAKDAAVLSPGVVDVAVLPPIDISDWQLENLTDHIESVRQLYIDTLHNWPEKDIEEQL